LGIARCADFWARYGSGVEEGEGYEAVKRKMGHSRGAGGGGIRSLAAERVWAAEGVRGRNGVGVRLKPGIKQITSSIGLGLKPIRGVFSPGFQ
jgi:hypothetical protein